MGVFSSIALEQRYSSSVLGQGGAGVLPGLLVMGSSEALLSGQRPPFRLLVRARLVGEGVLVHNIRHAVSENFVVSTKLAVLYYAAEIYRCFISHKVKSSVSLTAGHLAQNQ